jgi:ring-1,2-phenylacetyl-CoA epoxidase subunit PaaC
VKYHCRHSSLWLVRLGDGTELSHGRAQAALDDVWRYTGEMFAADDIDAAVQEHFDGPDLGAIRELWMKDVAKTVSEATLTLPSDQWMASGGKQGQHSEHLGFMLAEMQYLQRSFPGETW